MLPVDNIRLGSRHRCCHCEIRKPARRRLPDAEIDDCNGSVDRLSRLQTILTPPTTCLVTRFADFGGFRRAGAPPPPISVVARVNQTLGGVAGNLCGAGA